MNTKFLYQIVSPVTFTLFGFVVSGQEGGQPPKDTPSPTASKATAQKRPTKTDSVVVSANLTPEEIEDAKINDAYQPIYHLQRSGDCEQIMKICETEVIPRAEKSKFPETRNKFLFLANRAIARCEFDKRKFEEAGNRYEKLLEYVPVWPGKDDSAFPQVYESIGAARIGQGKLKEAEKALELAVQIFDEQIEKDLHSDSEFIRDELSKNVRMSEADTRDMLASVYLAEGKKAETMEMLDKAYQSIIQSNARPEGIQRIINDGRQAAALIGDETEQKKWNGRSTAKKN